MSDVGFRLATEADRHCAEETWLASFRTSHYAGPLAPWDRERWREVALPEIRRILGGPRVEIHVAFNPDMPPSSKSDIYGWLAIVPASRGVIVNGHLGPNKVVDVSSAPARVLFVYVKDTFRGAPWHFARNLFRRAGIDPWKDAYEYVCRTEVLLRQPGKDSRWDRPMIERMERAQWNPRATRWRQRNEREEEGGPRVIEEPGGPARR